MSLLGRTRIYYFAAGLLVALAAFWIGSEWPDFGERLLGGFNYDKQPRWFWLSGLLVEFSVWIIAVVLIALRFFFHRRNVKPMSYIIGAATSYVGCFVFLLSLPIIDDLWHRRPFDSGTWKKSLTQSATAEPIRLRMVDDLLRRHPLTGMSRTQVLDLLGQPPRTNIFEDWDLVYQLGPERGVIAIDDEWLVIRFDKNDTVSQAQIVRD